MLRYVKDTKNESYSQQFIGRLVPRAECCDMSKIQKMKAIQNKLWPKVKRWPAK